MIQTTLFALLVFIAFPAHALEPVRVAPNVFAFLGDNGEASPANRGFVANSGFIVGPHGVVVVDTGASFAHGQAMLSAIGRITEKPVVLVIITHAIQDFVFGASAFAERGIPLLAHRKTVELMKARCEHCLMNLRKILDDSAMVGTRLVIPERVVDDSVTLEVAGRKLELIWPGWASTPGDIVVFHPDTGVVFAGGLVTGARIPELRDGDFDGWLRAIDRLAMLPASAIVPGYGPPLLPAQISAAADYLKDLDAKLRQLYEGGKGLMEAVDNADIERYASWSLYPEQHRRNALRRYLQLEVEDLEGASR